MTIRSIIIILTVIFTAVGFFSYIAMHIIERRVYPKNNKAVNVLGRISFMCIIACFVCVVLTFGLEFVNLIRSNI